VSEVFGRWGEPHHTPYLYSLARYDKGRFPTGVRRTVAAGEHRAARVWHPARRRAADAWYYRQSAIRAIVWDIHACEGFEDRRAECDGIFYAKVGQPMASSRGANLSAISEMNSTG